MHTPVEKPNHVFKCFVYVYVCHMMTIPLLLWTVHLLYFCIKYYDDPL